MPLTIVNRSSTTPSPKLVDAQGRLTLEAQTLSGFLADCDWSDVFDHPALKPYVTRARIAVKESGEWLVPCANNAAGARTIEVEQLNGAAVAEALDGQDLVGLLTHYISHEYPRESMADRVVLNQFSPLLERAPQAEKLQTYAAMLTEMIGTSTIMRPMTGAMAGGTRGMAPKKRLMPMVGKPGASMTMSTPSIVNKPVGATESVKKLRISGSVDSARVKEAAVANPVPRITESIQSPTRMLRVINEQMNRQPAPLTHTTETLAEDPHAAGRRKMMQDGLLHGTFMHAAMAANRAYPREVAK